MNNLPRTSKAEHGTRGNYSDSAASQTWPGKRHTLLRWHKALDEWTDRHKDMPSITSTTVDEMRALVELSEFKLEHDGPSPGSIPSYYRLKTAVKTMEERIFVPRAFSHGSSTESDRLLATDKLTETHRSILCELAGDSRLIDDKLYAQRQSGKKDTLLTRTREDYTGLISEQVFFATIAALRDPNIIAMPASAHDDMKHDTDGYVYIRDDGESAYYEIPVQIKTSRAGQIKSPEVLPIYMKDFDRLGLIRQLVSVDNPSQNDFVREQGESMVGLILRKGQPFATANKLK